MYGFVLAVGNDAEYKLANEVRMKARQITIEMPYIGSVLSVNHAYVRNRRGQRVLRKEAKQWRDLLTFQVRAASPIFTPPLEVILECHFRDKRSACDPDNLAKLILDAVSNGLGINDRDLQLRTLGSKYGVEFPELIITVRDSQ